MEVTDIIGIILLWMKEVNSISEADCPTFLARSSVPCSSCMAESVSLRSPWQEDNKADCVQAGAASVVAS